MAARMLTVDQLQHIQQENRSSGCGIACIAMVARTNYDGVRKTIFGDQEKNLYLYHWQDIRDALKKYGISCDNKARRVYDWQRLLQMNDFSIVWCRQKRSDKIGHYVVCDPIRRMVHDPLRDSAV
jgi:hypothetical protein